jgi:uncharacterized cofD-like protein
MTTKNCHLETIKTWLTPGMNVKRWILLTMFGLALLGLSVLVLVDFTILGVVKRWMIDNIMIDFFGKNRLYTPNWVSLLLGAVVLFTSFFSIIYGIRKLLNSVITSLIPEREKAIADIVKEYRFRNKMLNIVVIGGGTGIFPYLQALKELPFSVTAIVTVADSGGSSGKLREEYGILAPGDIRRALIALSDKKSNEMEKMFNYRFKEGSLKDHSLGNLMITALTEMTGDFSESIYQLSRILDVKGKVIPFTLDSLNLCAEYEDGSVVIGEANIHLQGKRIRKIFFDPPYCKPLLRVIEELDKADVILLGPGSLYTSVLPCLIITPIADIIYNSQALKIYNANLMTEAGETDHYSVSDHLEGLKTNVGMNIIDYVLVNNGTMPQEVRDFYGHYNSIPVECDLEKIKKAGVTPLSYDLVEVSEGKIRHSPEKVRQALSDIFSKAKYVRKGVFPF